MDESEIKRLRELEAIGDAIKWRDGVSRVDNMLYSYGRSGYATGEALGKMLELTKAFQYDQFGYVGGRRTKEEADTLWSELGKLYVELAQKKCPLCGQELHA